MPESGLELASFMVRLYRRSQPTPTSDFVKATVGEPELDMTTMVAKLLTLKWLDVCYVNFT